MTTRAQITAKVEKGLLYTESDRTARTAKNTPGVQHIGSFDFTVVKTDDGFEFPPRDRTLHIFAKQVKS